MANVIARDRPSTPKRRRTQPSDSSSLPHIIDLTGIDEPWHNCDRTVVFTEIPASDSSTTMNQSLKREHPDDKGANDDDNESLFVSEHQSKENTPAPTVHSRVSEQQNQGNSSESDDRVPLEGKSNLEGIVVDEIDTLYGLNNQDYLILRNQTPLPVPSPSYHSPEPAEDTVKLQEMRIGHLNDQIKELQAVNVELSDNISKEARINAQLRFENIRLQGNLEIAKVRPPSVAQLQARVQELEKEVSIEHTQRVGLEENMQVYKEVEQAQCSRICTLEANCKDLREMLSAMHKHREERRDSVSIKYQELLESHDAANAKLNKAKLAITTLKSIIRTLDECVDHIDGSPE
ncbi:uncharacterized protein BCR38DRAFT_479963 [Pseudomassariella vexata]|uniref:Uncharacterized protein n=1 Tax=Pseudomassariella vexata TaxID=1141098 RepID=A0A1Y2EIT0_9PEZI|nr:uncharacterized protein BCR38DRAFT_479963 [Pseudomassariella vexata]ORY71473.1 hypothetical protein BCR38DRAFT_479963 [Pseudomassariella vexata]